MDLDRRSRPIKPQALVFDFDNTLYSYDACHNPALDQALVRLGTEFNCKVESVRSAFQQARAETKKRLGERASAHNRLLYFLKTFEILGFGPRPNDALSLEQLYWREYLARMELADGLADLFSAAKARKIPLALATELTAAIQVRKLIVLGLAETFDYIVISEECAAEKASGEVYELLREKMEVERGPHLWVIGDSDADMAARRHIGATTVFANFFGGTPPSERPSLVATSPTHLAALIDEACRSDGV